MKAYLENLTVLGIIGALIATGKILAAGQPVTWKLFAGRVILGSGVSLTAGALLLWWPGLSPLAVAGIGSALGIAGYQLIEAWLQKIDFGALLRRLKK